jgi:hypothetical protein
MYDIDVSDNLSAAQKSMRDWLTAKNTIEINTATARAVGVKAESLVSDYPVPSRKPLPLYYQRTRADGTTFRSKFKTLKQQRMVMALAAKGKIPYKRTGTLGRSITSRVDSVSASDARISIGSNKKHAPYVIDRKKQSNYHKGTWTPLQTDMERGLGALATTAARVYTSELMRRFRS